MHLKWFKNILCFLGFHEGLTVDNYVWEDVDRVKETCTIANCKNCAARLKLNADSHKWVEKGKIFWKIKS